MTCGCTNDKNLNDNKEQPKSQTVLQSSLDTMKDIPTGNITTERELELSEEIVKVNGKGYKIEYQGHLTEEQMRHVMRQIDLGEQSRLSTLDHVDPLYPIHFSPSIIDAEIREKGGIQSLNPGANPSIVSGASTGYIGNGTDIFLEFLMENKASLGYAQGVVKYIGSRHDIAASVCYQDIPDQLITCIPTTAWGLKTLGRVLVNTGALFDFGCVETFPCIAGENCTNRACTTFGSRTSFETQISVNAYNSSSPSIPTGLTITPGSGTLTISWNSVTDPRGGEVFAYYVNITTGGNLIISGYTQSGLRNIIVGGLTNGTTYTVQVTARSYNGIGGPAVTGSGTPVGATNPTIFSTCWAQHVTLPCGNSPSQPPIIPGTLFQIGADIANMGPKGNVRAVFKIDGVSILDTSTANLDTYNDITKTLWLPATSYTMPNKNVTLIVDAYGWNGTNWVLTNTVTNTISMSTPTCSGITLSPFTQTVNTGGTVNFTATTTPTTTPFTVNFKLRDGTLLSPQTTTGGIATFAWTAPSTAGTYYVHAEVGTPVQCTSTESVIQVSPPIIQHNVNITVLDSVTNSPIPAVNVTIGTQTLSTNTSGFVTFLVNEGSISVSVTKTGYNTYTTTELVFSDITKTYLLAPVTPATGSLRFITVPTAADVYFDTTLKGMTDASTGILTVSNLNVGPVSYTVKKTGYNNATGTATVAGGTTTDVAVSLTPVTPATGDVCLKSTPAGASINMDGAVQTGKTTALSTGGCTTSNTITGLSPGSHSYTLSLTGYQDKTGTFTITVGQVNNVDVGPLTVVTTIGSLTISSSPLGARIYIDDTDSGYITSPTGATVPNITQGDHRYKLILTGYKDATGTFHITAGQTTTVSNITLIQIVGTLRFFSTPVGAIISIGGVSKGPTTPTGLEVSNLPIGPTNYAAILIGYDTYNGTKTVIENTTIDVTITLTPTTTDKGSLVIETTPAGAEIFIDGADKQLTTPQTFTGMDIGGHVYELQKSGYYTVSGIFAITAGQTTTITKTLQSSGGTGGAGILFGVVGLAALGMMVTSKPQTQHIPPHISHKS